LVGLPNYPFEPHYVEVEAGGGARLRVHYLDDEPVGAEDPLKIMLRPWGGGGDDG
jgi:haloalkane dehalogenase